MNPGRTPGFCLRGNVVSGEEEIQADDASHGEEGRKQIPVDEAAERIAEILPFRNTENRVAELCGKQQGNNRMKNSAPEEYLEEQQGALLVGR